MKRTLVWLVALVLQWESESCHAVGLGDLVSVGLQAGGALVGAGVDKLKDSMKDPQAEEQRKQEEKAAVIKRLQEDEDKINSQPDLSPIQKEKSVRLMKRTYQQIEAYQEYEAKVKEEQEKQRDHIFTPEGMLGLAASAALNSPSAVLARANALQHDPLFKAQNNAALSQANALYQSGAVQTESKMALAQISNPAPVPSEGVAVAATTALVAAQMSQTTTQTPTENTQKKTVPVSLATESKPLDINAFSPDLQKRIFLEFQGSPKMTAEWNDLLKTRGFNVVTDKSTADVAYLIQGEYAVGGNSEFKSSTMDVGKILENPDTPVPAPDKSIAGSISSGMSKLMFGIAKAQGVDTDHLVTPMGSSADLLPSGKFKEGVLLVIDRQPKSGIETRYAVSQEDVSSESHGMELSKSANNDLERELGLITQ